MLLTYNLLFRWIQSVFKPCKWASKKDWWQMILIVFSSFSSKNQTKCFPSVQYFSRVDYQSLGRVKVSGVYDFRKITITLCIWLWLIMQGTHKKLFQKERNWLFWKSIWNHLGMTTTVLLLDFLLLSILPWIIKLDSLKMQINAVIILTSSRCQLALPNSSIFLC